jgi:Core-2/I-Branching enzyme
VSEGQHSFLIVAHDDESMLRRLVNRVAPLGPVFVHIDAKTDVSGWRLDRIDGTLLSNRVPVYWGDWSVVEATTLLLEAALADPLNVRFTLLSGLDYPIISNDELEKRARDAGNVIASREAPDASSDSRREVDYQRRFYRTASAGGPWSKLKNGFMNRVVYYRRPLDWMSVAPESGMRTGEMWWSINREFAEYAVAQIRSSRPLIDYFHKILCSDEKVFATLYGEFAREIVLEGTTYTKWDGGSHPLDISRDDIEAVAATEKFWFARKLRSTDAKTLDWLDGVSQSR